jgi:flagellar motor switch protein FliG
MADSPNQVIFLNGRQQIIEMLQFMDEKEKRKLLNNIQKRNSVMARELSEQSFSFKSLFALPKDELNKILERVNPAIIALSIFPLEITLQRKALSCLKRGLAEKTFEIMSHDLNGKKQEIKRAQEKIIQVAIQLSRQKYINI